MAADDRDREKPETQPERDEAPSVDELVRLLECLVDDPEAIQSLDAEIHERLRVAAGRLALPDRSERRERDDAAFEATTNGPAQVSDELRDYLKMKNAVKLEHYYSQGGWKRLSGTSSATTKRAL